LVRKDNPKANSGLKRVATSKVLQHLPCNGSINCSPVVAVGSNVQSNIQGHFVRLVSSLLK